MAKGPSDVVGIETDAWMVVVGRCRVSFPEQSNWLGDVGKLVSLEADDALLPRLPLDVRRGGSVRIKATVTEPRYDDDDEF
jgi:hypothetical protein